uniref:Nuclear protein MDM1 n=1 Tax=Anolis carolinensis TaxID=28377 RepID=H9G899_ANOCA|nr:PREDICTED: nuclear protein MDM1 isoform X1 [Anolis carolinensis]|eukprot:XP_003224673.1 PREDICTED: nuclear protein MDM1 isoform X1 [Anolis carolinensis]
MPVRWKGLSEYKRSFKWRKPDKSKPCSPILEEKCQWAGLRSDEFGISREPKFLSKRRVPYHNTQVSKSFEWNGGNDSEKDTAEPELHLSLESHSSESRDDTTQEKIKTPDAPRIPEKLHSSSPGSRSELAVALAKSKRSPPITPVKEKRTITPTEKDLEKINKGLKRVLQRKAGMDIPRSCSFPRSSEYQRQFVWKTPQKLSPVLAADKFIHSTSPSIPPFKSPVIIPETEYERSFKASSPAKEEKQQNSLEERERPAAEPVEASSGEKCEKTEVFSKATEDPSKQSKSEKKQKQPKQKHKPLCLHRSFRKMNTEYRSNFLSPAKYLYKDGAWIRIKRNMPDQESQNTLNTMWYMEVKELREKAEAYRQRVRGTHFSRDHLNQILSENNKLWDLSSNSSVEDVISNNVRALDLAGVPEEKLSPGPKFMPQPELSAEFQENSTGKLGMSDAATLPVKRRLVWGEPDNGEQLEHQTPVLGGGGNDEEKENKQESEDIKEPDKNSTGNDHQGENVNSPSANRADCSSGSCRGRLTTPELKAHGGAQRTHLDLTTPATGGAILVSPSKVRSSSTMQMRKGSPEKILANSQISREDIKRKSNMDGSEAVTPSHFPAAGLKTVDSLPLGKYPWPKQKVSSARVSSTLLCPEQSPVVPGVKSARDPLSYWSPSRRIQGTLRDPEFQHNGNVASSRRSWLQLPLQERNYHNEDDDDRLSQLSARSAASSSLASQVLERAQRRKENFWGKM